MIGEDSTSGEKIPIDLSQMSEVQITNLSEGKTVAAVMGVVIGTPIAAAGLGVLIILAMGGISD